MDWVQSSAPVAPDRPSRRKPPVVPVFTGTMTVLFAVMTGEP